MKLKGRKLLIVVDGSPQSLDAVRYVAQRRAPAGTKVTLMCVMLPREQTNWDHAKFEFSWQKMEAQRGLKQRDVNESVHRFLVDAETLLLAGHIPEKDVRVIVLERNAEILGDIMAEAAQGYDAVVVGRLGFTDTEALSFGSISAAIAREIQNIPVWVIGGHIRSREVLLAVDGSNSSSKPYPMLGAFPLRPRRSLPSFMCCQISHAKPWMIRFQGRKEIRNLSKRWKPTFHIY